MDAEDYECGSKSLTSGLCYKEHVSCGTYKDRITEKAGSPNTVLTNDV